MKIMCYLYVVDWNKNNCMLIYKKPYDASGFFKFYQFKTKPDPHISLRLSLS
jgi:hypothetical protein